MQYCVRKDIATGANNANRLISCRACGGNELNNRKECALRLNAMTHWKYIITLYYTNKHYNDYFIFFLYSIPVAQFAWFLLFYLFCCCCVFAGKEGLQGPIGPPGMPGERGEYSTNSTFYYYFKTSCWVRQCHTTKQRDREIAYPLRSQWQRSFSDNYDNDDDDSDGKLCINLATTRAIQQIGDR